MIHLKYHSPLLPRHPVVRRTVARFHDCVSAMDKEVGQILKQLKEDGLNENTIVFFFSDHGSGMPRHKRALLDSGMHVPLLVRFQKNGSIWPLKKKELKTINWFHSSILLLLSLTFAELLSRRTCKENHFFRKQGSR